MIKNEFYAQVEKAYINKATVEELKMLLGRGRAKKGMFLGELEEGELEIGQISATIKEILPASEIIQNLMKEYDSTFEKMSKTP